MSAKYRILFKSFYVQLHVMKTLNVFLDKIKLSVFIKCSITVTASKHQKYQFSCWSAGSAWNLDFTNGLSTRFRNEKRWSNFYSFTKCFPNWFKWHTKFWLLGWKPKI